MSMFNRTPASDEHPLGEMYDWVRNLPHGASVHVRTREGYVGRFDAEEIQDTPVEQFLLDEYGPDTYQLSAHAEGVFLAGKHTVAVGSRRDREVARKTVNADAEPQNDALRTVERLADVMIKTGAIPNPAPPDVELQRELFRAQLEAAQKVDPNEAFGKTLEFAKQVREMNDNGARRRASSSQARRGDPRSRRRAGGRSRARRRERGDYSDGSSGSVASDSSRWTPLLMGAAGAAVVSGAGYALQNPERVKNAAGRVGAWVQERFVAQRYPRGTPAAGPPAGTPGTPPGPTGGHPGPTFGSAGSTSPPPDASAEGASPWTFKTTFRTIEELLETGREISESFIGQRLIESVKRAMPMLTPREIAEQGLAKARHWMKGNPFLDELEKSPGEAYEAAADLVGLEGETRAQVKQALYAILGVAEAPAADPPEQETGAEQAS